MANAVTTINQGFDYQARVFWINACRLFDASAKVARVGYELNSDSAPRSFDDVALRYGTPIPDGRGGLTDADFFQVKFHVDHAGAFTCAELLNPAFIGATSVSLLQRLKDAVEWSEKNGIRARLWVVSPWQIDPGDPLAVLVSQSTGELRLGRLFDGTLARSKMGRIRNEWRIHLGLESDDMLGRVLEPLRIRAGNGDLLALNDTLNDKLQIAGLKPLSADCQTHPYDDLVKKLSAEGRCWFTRPDIEDVCKANGLWEGRFVAREKAVQVGLRSFMRWAEHMEDQTDHILCLVEHFDGRSIRGNDDWHACVLPKLDLFIRETMQPQCAYHLHIDAHSSIAFAAGYCLDSKSGVMVAPVQKTRGSGTTVWDPSGLQTESAGNWDVDEVLLSGGGSDVALAICVTHDVVEDVRIFAECNLPQVGRILVCRIPAKPGQNAVSDGPHAVALSQALSAILKERRSPSERQGRLHLFGAVPNALMFFIGQHSRGLGRLTLYEFDFEAGVPGGYQPSFSFPPPSTNATA